MVRTLARLIQASGFAVVTAAFPVAASADVIEVGPSGYSWVAGGPDSLPGAAGSVLVVGSGTDARASGADGSGDNGTGSDGSTAAAGASGSGAALATVDPASIQLASITEVVDGAGPMRWRDRVTQIARKYDISPILLEAVVWQESRWNELAVSPAGATGLTQLMPGTARQMGVDASDPMANLEGGARYLRMQLDAYHGDIEKALAAYNAGPGRVNRAGGVPNIRETRAYVASIMSRLTEPVRP